MPLKYTTVKSITVKNMTMAVLLEVPNSALFKYALSNSKTGKYPTLLIFIIY